MTMRYPAILLTTLVLSACGDSDDDVDVPELVFEDCALFDGTPSATNDSIIQKDANLTTGTSTELILYRPGESTTNVCWQQTQGPTISLLSAKSKVVSFTVDEEATYEFEVQYKTDSDTIIESYSFTVDDGDPQLVARLGHSVVENGSVSLRAFADDDIELNSITWQQISGPSIRFDDNNQNDEIAIFAAPNVELDSIIEIEVSAEDDSGNSYSDRVSLLVENQPNIPNNAYFDEPVAKVFPFNFDSPFADTLVACTYSNLLTSSCQIGQLPPLGQQTNDATPTIAQIMDRVVVSHEWMGVRFKQYIEQFDQQDDFKNLFRATTAIVLSYDVRPSFYWAATGAIYLDPNNLWLTANERDAINEEPDYRAGFGSDLQFVIPWRYVKNNEYVSFYYPPEDRESRELIDIKYELANLLYHELAHANDYLPQPEWNRYTDNSRFLDAALNEDEISDDLDRLYPLQSNIMVGLADVRFNGETATLLQRSYLPDDVVGFYRPDISNGFYNYTNEKEDLGILFEELMMSIRFGVQRDTAVTTSPEGDDISSNDYIVAWGQRGRIGEAGVIDRAVYISQRLLPEFDVNAEIDNLPDPIEMQSGQGWRDNLELNQSVPSPQLQPGKVNASSRKVKVFNTHKAHGRALPKH